MKDMTRYAATAVCLLLISGVYAQTPYSPTVKPALEPMEIPINRGCRCVAKFEETAYARESHYDYGASRR